MQKLRLSAATFALAALAGCSGSSSHGSYLGASTSAVTSNAPVTSSTTTPPPTAAPLPDDGTVPLIVVHGYFSKPADLGALLDRLAPGRTLVREMYVDDADALAANSMPKDAVVAFGYYKHSLAATAKYDGSSDIGGCPVARTDGNAAVYSISYADRLRRCVEGVKRATGSKKVDIVAHSMGGLVARAYTKWLSLDQNGESSVRRLFLIASPSRGLNALEAGILEVDPAIQPFMRAGEVVEMCYEARIFGGKSYVEQLNDNWDGWCQQHGVRYGGISGTGAPGGVQGSGQASYMAKLFQQMSLVQQIALFAGTIFATQAFPNEVAEAMEPSDGAIRISSSRLDQAPFLAADFFAFVEAEHTHGGQPELATANNTFTAECIRGYCLHDGEVPHGPTCSSADVAAIDSAGRATWIAATIDCQNAIAAELEETILTPATSATAAIRAYGAALRPGQQRILFPVSAGAGSRQYQLVVYGEKGPLVRSPQRTFNVTGTALEAAPSAKLSVTAGPSAAHATATSPNASAGDATLRFSWRLDGGAWSAWAATATYDTPLLGPGLHRIEVVSQHSSNAAGLLVDGTVPAAVDLEVDVAGTVTVLP